MGFGIGPLWQLRIFARIRHFLAAFQDFVQVTPRTFDGLSESHISKSAEGLGLWLLRYFVALYPDSLDGLRVSVELGEISEGKAGHVLAGRCADTGLAPGVEGCGAFLISTQSFLFSRGNINFCENFLLN